MRSDLESTNVDKIIIDGLHEFLADVQIGLNLAGNSIAETYFASPLPSTTSSGEEETKIPVATE